MALPDLTQFAAILADSVWHHLAEVTAEVKQVAPVYRGADPRRQSSAGKYRDELEGEIEPYSGGVRLKVMGAAPLTDWIIEGTSAHEIVAVRAGTLMFYATSGGIMFRRIVHHPGTQPNPFYERALPPIREFEDRIVDEALLELWSRTP